MRARRTAATASRKGTKPATAAPTTWRTRPAATDRTVSSSATAPAARRRARRSRSVATARGRRRRAPRRAATARRDWARTATTATATRATAAPRRARSRTVSAARRGAATTRSTAPSGNSGKCLELPIVYRDFKNESVSGGHPDFFYMGAPCRGPADDHRRRRQTGGNGVQQAVLRSQLRADPRRRTTRRTDAGTWRRPNLGVERQADVQHVAHRGGREPALLRLPVHRLEPRHQRRTRAGLLAGRERTDQWPDATRRRQWPPDVPRPRARRHQRDHVRPVVDGQRVHRQHAHGRHAGDASDRRGPVPVLEPGECWFGGFFPLDPPAHGFPLYTAAPVGPGTAPQTVGTEAMLCNLYPYWYSSTSFGAGKTARATSTSGRPACFRPTRRRTARPA